MDFINSLSGLQEFKFLNNCSNKEIFFTVKVICGDENLASPFDGNCYFNDKTELSSLKNGGKNMIIGIDRSNQDYNITNKWIFIIKTFIDEEFQQTIYLNSQSSNNDTIYRNLGVGGCYTDEGSYDTKRIDTVYCKRKYQVGDEIKFVNQFLCSDPEHIRVKKLKHLEYQNNKAKLEKLTKQLKIEEHIKESISKQLIEKTRTITSILKEIEKTRILIGPSPESQFVELT